jgi:hypothetical protein
MTNLLVFDPESWHGGGTGPDLIFAWRIWDYRSITGREMAKKNRHTLIWQADNSIMQSGSEDY